MKKELIFVFLILQWFEMLNKKERVFGAFKSSSAKTQRTKMSLLKKSALAFCIVTSFFSSTDATIVPYVPPVAQQTINGCLVGVSVPYWLYVVGFAAYYHITKK